MFRVGLTGGIGCGKTTVSNLFKNYGISIIDTDIISHQITQPDGPAYQAVINLFGTEIVSIDETINRKKIATIIFNDEEKKKQLQDLLHPIIWIIVEEQVSHSKSPYTLIVVPLLFEGKHQARFDSTLLVSCSVEDQVKRVMERDHRNESDIKAIINNQLSNTKKIELADKVINNIGDITNLKNEIETIHKFYLEQCNTL